MTAVDARAWRTCTWQRQPSDLRTSRHQETVSNKPPKAMAFVEVDFTDLDFHEQLGSGSSGSVYRVTWISKEREVAVKKLLNMEQEVGPVDLTCISI